MKMRKVALLVLAAGALGAWSAPAFAEQWVIFANALGGWGVDTDALKPDAKGIFLTKILVFSPTPRELGGKSFIFSTNEIQLDCGLQTFWPRASEYFDADGRSVAHVSAPAAAAPQPMSPKKGVLSLVLEKACKNVALPGDGVEAGDLAAAMRAFRVM